MTHTSTPLQAQRALVIGASGGIGSAIARELASRGSSVVGLGLNKEKLADVQRSLHPVAGHGHLACDLSIHAHVELLCADLAAQALDFDTVVIASGEFHRAMIQEADPQMFDRLYAINVRGPYALLRATIAGLIRRRGQIAIVSSTAALRGRPGFAQYCATQAALRSLAESIREELNPFEVRVLAVYPGRTATLLWQTEIEPTGANLSPELLLQPQDIAQMVGATLSLPRTAEVTDLHIRPLKKSY